ncbi:MAG: GNAT family N-acetyltransferase, partial [candidate division Zixibacteria bacterium]|nr:GNAT family N-acetyltransferase [candidate division Zixibacteria bacterium]
MKSGSISYRRCRKKDLVPSIKVIRSSFNHLRKQTGKEPLRWTVRGVPPFFEHLIKTDPKTFYCAWYKDKVIGFAGAIMRGKQWYLAWLFIHPRYQDKGVGGKLLEKVWREGKGITHALSTFAYNTQAVGLYSKFGMAPLCTVPLMYTKP